MFLTDIFSRLLWTAALIGIALTSWVLLNRWILRRLGNNPSPLEKNGIPTIVYFTTPHCIPCKTFQRPAIERLQQMLGDHVHVVEVDASTRPDLASRWGVLSVPTIFVLDAGGQPRHVNHGLTSTERLLKQLESAGWKPPRHPKSILKGSSS